MTELFSKVSESRALDFAIDADSAYVESCRRLSRKFPSLRVSAVRELAEHGDRAMPHLVRALNDEHHTVRVAACEAMGRIGTEEVIEPLCAALKSLNIPTRAAAARALGEVGDVRAIPALREALRECYSGQSARFQRALGLFLAPLIMGFVGWVFLVNHPNLLWGLLLLAQAFWIPWCLYPSDRRGQNRVCAAIAEAIGRIAAAEPSPELRQLVPELKAISANLMLQERGTRKAAHLAIEQIEMHTAHQSALPVPAASPLDNPAVLPIASHSKQATSPTHHHTTRK